MPTLEAALHQLWVLMRFRKELVNITSQPVRVVVEGSSGLFIGIERSEFLLDPSMAMTPFMDYSAKVKDIP